LNKFCRAPSLAFVPAPDAHHANLRRGILLFEQDRYREAAEHLQAAISADPEDAEAYAWLARCWNEQPLKQAEAVSAIDRAIGLDPENSFYFGIKTWILTGQGKALAATHVARRGLELDPLCPVCLNALANAFTHLHEWKNAEIVCRRILEFDADDSAALNLLAQALRHQHRWRESRAVVDQLLGKYPNDSFGLSNAGHAALAVGDHLRANELFREALRLEPGSEFARQGLLASLRGRIWLLNVNRRLLSFLAGLARHLHSPLRIGLALAGMCLSFIAFFFACALLNLTHHRAGTLLFLTVILTTFLYLALSVITVFLGNFLLLTDPLGRYALNSEEKIMAILPGFGFLFTLALVASKTNGWPIFLGLVALLGSLLLSVQIPLWLDRWQSWRAKKALETDPPA
jgi:tetratricopeptide (TPR) repeat protein